MLFNLTPAVVLVLSLLSLGGVDARTEGGVGGRVVRRQATNQMPAEIAVKSDGNGIQAFDRRDFEVKRQVAEETPSYNDGTGIKPFRRSNSTPLHHGQFTARQLNEIPAEAATKSENGQIVPFTNKRSVSAPVLAARQAVNDIPAEAATKSLNGQIVPFEKRQNDIPVAAEDVNLVPAEKPTKGDGFGGVIELL